MVAPSVALSRTAAVPSNLCRMAHDERMDAASAAFQAVAFADRTLSPLLLQAAAVSVGGFHRSLHVCTCITSPPFVYKHPLHLS